MANMARTDRFRRELLPIPRIFYENALGKLTKPSRGWARGRCPFHESKSGLSFSVNLDSGGFYCFGCQASGGDVVSFVQRRDGLTFKAAAQSLGAWDDAALKINAVVIHRPGPPVSYLVLDLSIDGNEYHSEAIPDEPKTELQQTRRFYAQAKDRLAEIRNGDAEEFEGEEEAQWGILAASWELIQMEVGR
jgi:hypothetical protein